jgi:hypothetical protein
VPIYELLGGKVRDKLKVYAWIGGDRPADVLEQAYAILQQCLTKMILISCIAKVGRCKASQLSR